ncbi:MAG: nucleotidyl transferase AbiEii/AbiGii toxin family protein [Acidobacteriota bacterium]
MDQIARQSDAEQTELFREAANSKGVHFQIIEKDFWVCWTLKRLFSLPEIGPQFIFKGGTSLSKAYHIIERFSEDIDVAIERSFLGFGDEVEFQSMSKNKQRPKAIKELDDKCKEFVQTRVLESLRTSFQTELRNEFGIEWGLDIAEDDRYGQTILFTYPRDQRNSLGNELDYIKPYVRIEMGARPTNEPVQLEGIQSYASEEFPDAFADPTFKLNVLSAERTFWEKATILHEQYHRADDYKSAERMSRHYYDLFKLAHSQFADKAIANRDLLRQVVDNKKLFFSRGPANYDEALVGELHLVPREPRVETFKQDYRKMDIMFFDEPPKFDEIITSLSALEEQINAEA